MRKRLVGRSLIVGTLAIYLILLLSCGSPRKEVRYEAIDGDTIKVQSSDGSSIRIRYAAVNAPGHVQTLGKRAFEFNEELIHNAQDDGTLIVDLKPADSTNDGKDRNGRPLTHVFVGGERSAEGNVQVRLVAEGFARLDVRKPIDKDIANGEDFDVRYGEDLIAAQIEAAMARRGWWGEDDKYADCDLIIAAIKQWSDDEIVYIINRGPNPVNLAEWELTDDTGGERNTLVFREHLTNECLLSPGGLFRVHSGPVATGRSGEHTSCSELELDFYWTGHEIWDQEGDTGTLHAPNNATANYAYTYPLTKDYWK